MRSAAGIGPAFPPEACLGAMVWYAVLGALGHPSVLILVVDSLRADHCSLLGYGRRTTPALDEFAGDGLVFEQARAPSSWTKPSVASLLTGLPPGLHAAEEYPDRLSGDAITLPELLRAAGYRTLLLSDDPWISDRAGFKQGMDEAVDPYGDRGIDRIGLPRNSLLGRVLAEAVLWRIGVLGKAEGAALGAARMNERLVEWLDSLEPGAPWFAYLHYMEPHIPYAAPPPWDRKFTDRPLATLPMDRDERGLAPFFEGKELSPEDRQRLLDSYDAEILYWDHCFGRLLADLRARGRLDDCIVVVTSDHGEGFYDHATWDHRNSLHEELLHVPLVFHGPGVEPRRAPAGVSLEGVPGAVLELAGFETPEHLVRLGQSLFPPPEADRVCFQRLKFRGTLELSKVVGGIKWIFSARDDEEFLQCFDLISDPAEKNDLAGERAGEAARTRTELLDRAAHDESRALRGRSADLSGDTQDLLRGLGYFR